MTYKITDTTGYVYGHFPTKVIAHLALKGIFAFAEIELKVEPI